VRYRAKELLFWFGMLQMFQGSVSMFQFKSLEWGSGRLASARCRHVAALWQPYVGAGPTGQAMACLKCATTPSTSLSLYSLLPCSFVRAEAERHTIAAATSSPSSCVASTTPLLDSSRTELHRCVLYLLHLLVEPIESR
jgi:hypothetical protein